MDKIYVFISTLSLIVGIWLTIKDYVLKKEEAPVKKQVDFSAAVKNLADALNTSTDELAERFAEAVTLRAEIKAMRDETRIYREATEKYRDEKEKHTAELDLQIQDLKNQLETQNLNIANIKREYEAEAQNLRADNATMRKQMIDLKSGYEDMNRKYSSAKSVIEKLIKALNDANIPLPDLSGENLSDSVRLGKLNK